MRTGFIIRKLIMFLILMICIVIQTNYAFGQMMPGRISSILDSNLFKTDDTPITHLIGKISPINGASMPGNQITFTWTGPAGYYYWICIGTGPYDPYVLGRFTGSNFYCGTLGLNVGAITLNNFPADGTTYGWVIDYCTYPDYYNCSGGPFDVWTFTNVASTPAKPSLSSPANSGSANGTTVTFSWYSAQNAEKYHIQVYNQAGQIFKENTAVAGTSTSFANFPADGSQYTWHVRGWNASSGYGPFSDTWRFTNGVSSKPGSFSLTSPPNGGSGNGSSVTLRWGAASQATTYYVTAAYDSAFSRIIMNHYNVGNTTYTVLSGLSEESETVYWKVEASNSIGSTLSDTWRFTNGPGSVPATPTLTSPFDGDTLSGSSATFSWSDTARATDYYLQIARDSDFSQIFFGNSVGNVLEYPLSGFIEGEYYWRVAARNSIGTGSYSSTRTFYWDGVPDLQVTYLYPPTNLNAGAETTIRAQISNNGDGNAEPFYAALIVDNEREFDCQRIDDGVAAKGNTMYEVTIPEGFSKGTHLIRVEADYYDSISEIEESNNIMTGTWSWEGIEPPSGVTADPGPGSGQVTVRWNSSYNPYISYYNMYVRTALSFEYSLAKGNISAEWNNDFISNLTNDEAYYFVVTAVDNTGTESAYSNEAMAIPIGTGDSTGPSAPSNLTAINAGSGSGLTLTWGPSTDDTGVEYYIVYRLTNSSLVSDFNHDNYQFISKTTYTDTGLSDSNTYYYRVQAVDFAGNVSELSNLAYGTPIDQVAPSAPSVNISAEKETVYIWWSVPEINTDGSSLTDLAGYNVYRRLVSETYSSPINGSVLVTNPDFLDASVASGETYYYAVKAVDSDGNEGPFSNEVSGSPDVDLAPAAPAGLSITEKETSLDLSWSPNHEPDLEGYYVYRGLSSGDRSTRLNSNLLTTGWYSDGTASAGQTYYYAVTAVDLNGNESGFSNEISGMIGQGKLEILAPTFGSKFIMDFSSIFSMFKSFAAIDIPGIYVIRYKYSIPEVLKLPTAHLVITSSQTGQKVYTTSDPLPLDPYFTWDGKYKDKNECVPDGLYNTRVYITIPGMDVPYVKAVEPESIQVSGCSRIEITKPIDNPNPDLYPNIIYYPFLSTDPIIARATFNFPGNASDLVWTVTANNNVSGTISNPDPADMRGALLVFLLSPVEHATYTPGAGSFYPSPPLSYRIQAKLGDKSDEHVITQDQKDIIRQEYLNHDLMTTEADREKVARTLFHPIAGYGDFSPEQIRNIPGKIYYLPLVYSMILGNPAQFAQAIQDEYNRLLSGDDEVVKPGTFGLTPDTIIVRPALVNISTFEKPLVHTPPCYPAAPTSCKNLKKTIVENGKTIEVIVAGEGGRAQTTVLRGTHFRLQINSSWRNPERNEKVEGAPNSRHQYGDAVDLYAHDINGFDRNRLDCVLETAAKRIAKKAFAETGPDQVKCDGSETVVSHIHAER